MNRRRFNAVLAGIGFVLLGAGTVPGIIQAAEPPAGEVTTGEAATAGEDSATVWEQTREVSADTWEATKEGSARAWEATKEGSARAWDKTREISADAWEATKEGTASAWDATSDMVQGEQQPDPGPEAEAGQERPAETGQTP